jgi:c-di-GMP-binding flagellar brake protein YcgR
VTINDVIYLTQKIQVTITGYENEWYASSIQDFNNNEICISIPVRETRSLLLFRSERVDVTFITESARYKFTSVVLGRRQDNVPMYVLSAPADYERIQLREFVRVPITLQVDYAQLPQEGEEPVFSHSDSVDLSGGGIRLLTQENLPKDTRILVNFTLPFKRKPRQFRVYGVVARSYSDDITKMNHAGVRFLKVSNQEMDTISSYLFSVMSQNRREKLEVKS